MSSIFDDYPELAPQDDYSESVFETRKRAPKENVSVEAESEKYKDLDDPIWEYTLKSRLAPYMPYVKRFWETWDKQDMKSTGVADFIFAEGETPIAGLYVRCTSTPVRSPIKNVQMFPFVPTAYLKLAGISGGANRMVERVCKHGIEIDGFAIIEKHNLPSTYHKGQFVAFVPKSILEDAKDLGKYVYLTAEELAALACGILPKAVSAKCGQYLQK